MVEWQVDFLPVHDAQHLLAYVLSSLQGPGLDEVLEAPGIRELVVLPRVIHSQQRQVISLKLEELCLLLVSKRLFVLKMEGFSLVSCQIFLSKFTILLF